MSMLENRSLVGFLSLLNGILDPTQVACESGTLSSRRSSEGSAEVETNASAPATTRREIPLMLADSASTRVDIQLIERAGSLHLAVRTPDQELTKALQANLAALVGRFETKGYKTESWTPAAPRHASVQPTAAANNSGHSQDQSEQGGARGGQQQQQQGQPDHDPANQVN